MPEVQPPESTRTLDLDLLRTFLAVYRLLSISKAARELHLTQPAVSRQIRALEAQVGGRLFDRSYRGVCPRPSAHCLADRVQPHLDALAATANALHPFASPLEGRVALGGSADQLTSWILPSLAPLVCAGLQIDVTPGQVCRLLDDLVDGALDLVVATEPQTRPSLLMEPLYVEHVMLVASPVFARSLPPKSETQAWKAAVASGPFVSFSSTMPMIRDYLRALEIAPSNRPALVIPDLRGVVAAAECGAGLAVLPKHLVAAALAAGRLLTLDDSPTPANRTICLAARSGALSRPLVADVWRHLIRAGARLRNTGDEADTHPRDSDGSGVWGWMQREGQRRFDKC